jgi:hypothetical protein
MDLLFSLVSADKVGGWARAAVAAVIATAFSKWPFLKDYLDPSTQAALGVAVAGVAVGAWSHIAKHVAAQNAKVAANSTAPSSSKSGIGTLSAFLLGFLILGVHDVNAQTKSPPINTLASWADTDIAAAIVLAGALPDLQDGIGQACWKTVQSVANVVKAHPLPLTFKLASDIQAARLVQMGLNRICSDPNCSQVWADLNNAANALQIIPLAFQPASLCAKIPTIKSTPAINGNGNAAVPPVR